MSPPWSSTFIPILMKQLPGWAKTSDKTKLIENTLKLFKSHTDSEAKEVLRKYDDQMMKQKIRFWFNNNRSKAREEEWEEEEGEEQEQEQQDSSEWHTQAIQDEVLQFCAKLSKKYGAHAVVVVGTKNSESQVVERRAPGETLFTERHDERQHGLDELKEHCNKMAAIDEAEFVTRESHLIYRQLPDSSSSTWHIPCNGGGIPHVPIEFPLGLSEKDKQELVHAYFTKAWSWAQSGENLVPYERIAKDPASYLLQQMFPQHSLLNPSTMTGAELDCLVAHWGSIIARRNSVVFPFIVKNSKRTVLERDIVPARFYSSTSTPNAHSRSKRKEYNEPEQEHNGDLSPTFSGHPRKRQETSYDRNTFIANPDSRTATFLTGC
ncbi:hypothetical protein BC629DRAFT_1571546 [Irpex lacteus]|nr:hypothetical protein BC629DRAFT_1571546 [Irpex lacteus]